MREKKKKCLCFVLFHLQTSTANPTSSVLFPTDISNTILKPKKENQAAIQKSIIHHQTVTKSTVKASCIPRLSTSLRDMLIMKFHLHLLFGVEYLIQMTKSLNKSEHTSKELAFPNYKGEIRSSL